MSIAAIVDRVEYTSEVCELHLKAINKDDGPGQRMLTVLDPPFGLECLVGMTIWGGSDFCCVGQDDKLMFDRVGYTQLRLKQKER